MSLRTKIILFIILSTVVTTVVTSFMLIVIILREFQAIEREQVVQNIQRVQEVIAVDIEHLDTKLSDWTMWDDTYEFIHNHNSRYIESNLQDLTLENLKINLMVFLDSAGQVVWERAYDVTAKRAASMPEGFHDSIKTPMRFPAYLQPTIIYAVYWYFQTRHTLSRLAPSFLPTASARRAEP